jgi:hypothetical protein
MREAGCERSLRQNIALFMALSMLRSSLGDQEACGRDVVEFHYQGFKCFAAGSISVASVSHVSLPRCTSHLVAEETYTTPTRK